MTDKTDKASKPKKKRLPRGMRKHIRRLKQEARQEGTVYRPPIIRSTPAKTAEE